MTFRENFEIIKCKEKGGNMNLTPIIKDSFLQFGGAVLQSRALPDARDMMKPSARQIFYCLYTDGFIHEKPFQKTLKAIGSAFRMYIHGDSSAEGVIMRAGQPFAMRYPLIEVEGSYGTLLSSGSWSAPRYTSSRLSSLSNYLFADIKKDVIDEWRNNYDDTEQYPMVLPSKGFYNIVNGTLGIGVGASCSIPQYNLREVNEALIKLLWNKDVEFDEIFCVPDFATGALLLNENEIKESHRNGKGAACKLRSVVEFDDKERCFVVKEIPYMVYTETICGQLEEIINDDERNPGIERFNDLTGKDPLIKIYLKKNANPNKVLKFLYKNTSLQTHYGINFTVLENGRFPKVYDWKQLLQAHLDHEQAVYTRGYQHDIAKLNARLHIIEGLLIAMASINEVVQTIKKSATTSEAQTNLIQNFNLDELQTKAILDMKLARLAHLEVSKLEKEKSEKETERDRIQAILDDENLLKKEIEKGLREVMEKFGDARRTKILNLEQSDDEPLEIKQLQISLTNKNNLYVNEASSLYTQRRGGVGAKLKVKEGEYVLSSRPIESNEEILLFSQNGNFYPVSAQDIPREQITPIEMLIPLKSGEKIKALTSLNKKEVKPFIIFITKNGFIKKSNIEEYNIKRKTGTKALTLEDDDEIVNIVFAAEEKLGLLSTDGNFILVETNDIRPIGRVSKGVKGMKLNAGESVVSAHLIPENTSYLISISGEGLFKRTTFSEFSVQGKNTKGAKIQRLNEGDWMADFLPMTDEKDVLISSTRSSIKLNINDVPIFSKGALGNKSIKLNATDNVVGIS